MKEKLERKKENKRDTNIHKQTLAEIRKREEIQRTGKKYRGQGRLFCYYLFVKVWFGVESGWFSYLLENLS